MHSGREIYLTHNPEVSSHVGTFFEQEVQHLKENGYHFVKEGDYWHAIR